MLVLSRECGNEPRRKALTFSGFNTETQPLNQRKTSKNLTSWVITMVIWEPTPITPHFHHDHGYMGTNPSYYNLTKWIDHPSTEHQLRSSHPSHPVASRRMPSPAWRAAPAWPKRGWRPAASARCSPTWAPGAIGPAWIAASGGGVFCPQTAKHWG